MKVYLPGGRTQIVRLVVPTPDQQPDRILIKGDNFDFDNTLYVVPPRKLAVRIVYIGDDGASDTSGLQYYLRSAIGQTPRRTVDFAARRPNEAVGAADLLDARLVVVSAPGADPEPLRRYAETGGRVLWVLHEAGDATAQALSRVMRAQTVRLAEASVKDYAMISRIEFDHPLFAPFADPRFSDFSKIRFWKHRRVTIDGAAATRILARFDNDDSFLVEQTVGKGSLLIMSAGWHPADSQLALSTKFVPLIEGMLRSADADAAQAQLLVNAFEKGDHPGIYRRDEPGRQVSLAVNLAPDESRTAPIALEELEQWGVRLSGKPPNAAEMVSKQQHLQTLELENRQKLWRWIIAAVLGLLAAETLLAGRLARRTTVHAAEPQVTT